MDWRIEKAAQERVSEGKRDIFVRIHVIRALILRIVTTQISFTHVVRET